MPFVQRVVEPKFLSRQSLHGEDGHPLVTDYELEAVTNNTLSSALRQLASLVLIANDIFEDLAKQLQDVCERSKKLRTRIEVIEGKVVAFDPRKVTVPESDISTFSLRTEHFSSCKDVAATKSLFAVATRPESVQRLYKAAAKTPVHVMRQLDRYRRDGRRSSRYFLCTPILGGERRSVAKIKHKPGIDIETRMPAVVNELRRWTSEEAFGDITVTPDCTSRIAASVDGGTIEEVGENTTIDAGTDHRLPSPEEQIQTVALRFPAELVAVDVSGRIFDRMTSFRRSLIHVDADGTVRRRGGRSKKPRGRRRNTIAGTDQRELEQAVIGETPDTDIPDIGPDTISVVRSASSDLLRSKDDSPSDSMKSKFNTLKQWSKVKLKLIRSVSGESSKASPVSPEEANIYETITTKGKKGELKHDKKQSSAKNAGTNIPISTSSGAMNMAVKLREGSVRRRALTNGKEDPLHSSSGNWSASSESGRASIGSENTATTHQPKSTTTLSSAATSSNSLNHHQAPSSSVSSRRKFLNTSASSSISEGTLTPDIMPDLVAPFADDGETSSIYSCDTEGYYTSFHLDSGLKTLKEEEASAQTPLHSSIALSTSPGRGNVTLTAENEYELFGKGSTSTTTSSAGTVCTTLLVSNDNNMSVTPAPAVPERKSSLEGKQEKNSQMVVAMIHKQQTEGPSESPDSGHNTSSSPVDSTNSPPGTLTGRSSEYEFSESDLEGVDRIERIRVKTTINSSRIPSMCVITPPQSDDETCQYVPSYYNRKHNSQTLPSVSTNGNINNFPITGYRDNKNDLNMELTYVNQKNSAENLRSFSLPRTYEKQLSTDSDRSSETEPSRVRSRSACRPTTPPGYGTAKQFERSASMKAKVRGLSPSPTRKILASNDAQRSNNHQHKAAAPMLKSSLQPFNNMLDKVRGVLSSAGSGRKGSKSSAGEESDSSPTETKIFPVDAGDYVTIADVRNNVRTVGNQGQAANTYSNTGAVRAPPDKLEYVSLNELPETSRASSPSGNVLTSVSDSLERKKRQGARVTLDSEGKVVYSSDSLRRNKGAHTTFEPGPYVKDPTVITPVGSPVPAHRIPKSTIRPVVISNQQGRNSPCLVEGSANVLRSPVSQRGRPMSPQTRISPTRNKTSPTSPQLGKVIIRAGSKTTPMMRVASPPPVAVASRPMSPKPSSASLSGRGAYVHMQSTHQRCTSPPGRRSTTPAATQAAEEDEGQLPSDYDCLNQRPPRYVSPPPPPTRQPPWSPSNHNTTSFTKMQDPQAFWTLPVRKHQQQGAGLDTSVQRQDPYVSRRFNTIATTGSGKNMSRIQSCSSYDDRPHSTAVNYGGTKTMSSVGACQSSQNRTAFFQGQNLVPQNRVCSGGLKSLPKYPTPATIPNVPINERAYIHSNNGRAYSANYKMSAPMWCDAQSGLYSSTPTKKDNLGSLSHCDPAVMGFSTTFSPIEKYSRKDELQHYTSRIGGNRSVASSQQHKHSQPGRSGTPTLVSAPKSSMTSEEIFAAIHKSKKRLNIKTDSDSYSRSGSPSCSSMTSLSPGSSESSVHGIGRSTTPVKNTPETGSFNGDNSAGSRHSWSPNSGEYFDFYSRFEHKTPSPVTSPGSRQSWACDRLGPRQQTSRNDFKRLLLEQGAKSNPIVASSGSGGRISAVEQLRLTRQQKLEALTPNTTGSNSYTPRSPVEKRTVASKLLQSPRSNTTWRFASPRTDVLSSTILEDCAEEEKASRSPQDSPSAQHTNHPLSSTPISHGNSSVRRPLNLSFDSNGNNSPNSEITKQQDMSRMLQRNSNDSSSQIATKHLATNSNSKNYISSETAMTHQNILSSKVTNIKNGGLLSPELLSPSNVKENVNTNLQPVDKTVSVSVTGNNVASLKTHHPIAHSINRLILQSPSPRINMLLAKQRPHQYSNHGTNARSILGTLTSSKSPPKATLETAL